MSIDKRNFALPAIVAVAAVITINAVVGQDGKHPAPLNKNEPHQKITKTEKPIASSKTLQRKSRPAKTVAITPRPRPGVTKTTAMVLVNCCGPLKKTRKNLHPARLVSLMKRG